MSYFRVTLQGKGIDVPSEENGPSIVGFFTTRLVQASTIEEAVEKAKTIILAEWTSGDYARSNKGSLPSLAVSAIQKGNFIENLKSKYSGYTFYLQSNEE